MREQDADKRGETGKWKEQLLSFLITAVSGVQLIQTTFVAGRFGHAVGCTTSALDARLGAKYVLPNQSTEAVQLTPKDSEDQSVRNGGLQILSHEVQKRDKSCTVGREQHDKALQSVAKLFASGLPTIPSKLAQHKWELEFLEMEEFLPTNKVIQALELVAANEGGARSVFH